MAVPRIALQKFNADALSEMSPLLEDDARSTATSSTIYCIAFATGAVGPITLGAQYLLKDKFGLGPADSARYLTLLLIGWTIKPVWGLLSDALPIWGQHRKPYVLWVSAVGMGCCASYSFLDSTWTCLLALVTTNACVSFLSVIGQALLVRRSGESLHAASFNFSSYFGISWATSGVATYGAGLLLPRQPADRILTGTGLFFVPLLLVAPSMCEAMTERLPSARKQLAMVWELYKRREVWGPALFCFSFAAMPTATSAMFFFNVDVLRFSPSFIALVSLMGIVAAVPGVLFYHRYLTEVPLRVLFGIITVACVVVSTTPLIQVLRLNQKWNIDDHVFALVDTCIIHSVSDLLWIPMYVMASRLCPPTVEGLAFALFMSIRNTGKVISGLISSRLTASLSITLNDLSNLWILVFACAMSMVVPLLLLPLVPVASPKTLRNEQEEAAGERI